MGEPTGQARSEEATYAAPMALRIGAHVDQEDPIAEAQVRGATLGAIRWSLIVDFPPVTPQQTSPNTQTLTAPAHTAT